MRKNVSGQIIGAEIVATNGTAFTGSVTCYVTIDNGTQTIGSIGSGICAHKGNGYHSYTPSQTETNGNHIAFTFIGSGAVPATQQVYTIGYDPQTAISNILADTSELQTDNIPGTLSTMDGKIDSILADTNELQTDDVPGLIGALNDVSLAAINAEVDTALSDIHLDHLFATDYDPASKPGAATALLNELIEDDGGVSRFTINALETGPSGTGASAEAIADAVLDEVMSGHTTAGTLGKAIADTLADTDEMQQDDVPGLIGALNNISAAQVNAEVDAAIETYHLDHLLAANYDPAAKPGVSTALLNELVEDDSGVSRFTINALEQAPSGSGPTAAAVADAVWDEFSGDHNTENTFGRHVSDMLTTTSELQQADIPGAFSALNNLSLTDIQPEIAQAVQNVLYGQLTESYAANGVAPTLAQAVLAIHQILSSFQISGTTLTVRQLDGQATAFVMTLDSSTSPRSTSRD